MAAREELVISKSRTFLSRRALAASSFNCSIECPVLMGLWSPESGGGTSASGISSGVETGTEVVIKFNGDPGASPPDIFLAGGPFISLCDPTLAERPWLALPASILALCAATMLLVDCPLPPVCGRVSTGDSSGDVFLNEANEACWCSFEGEVGLCGGENVPVVFANLGDAIRDDEDTTELGRGGGKCGVDSRSGVPFA